MWTYMLDYKVKNIFGFGFWMESIFNVTIKTFYKLLLKDFFYNLHSKVYLFFFIILFSSDNLFILTLFLFLTC